MNNLTEQFEELKKKATGIIKSIPEGECIRLHDGRMFVNWINGNGDCMEDEVLQVTSNQILGGCEDSPNTIFIDELDMESLVKLADFIRTYPEQCLVECDDDDELVEWDVLMHLKHDLVERGCYIYIEVYDSYSHENKKYRTSLQSCSKDYLSFKAECDNGIEVEFEISSDDIDECYSSLDDIEDLFRERIEYAMKEEIDYLISRGELNP